MTDQPIAIIPKNSKEQIEISLTTFKGHELVDVRIFTNDGTKHVATRKGVTIAVRRLPELIQGLQQAEAEARRRGLLDEDGVPAHGG